MNLGMMHYYLGEVRQAEDALYRATQLALQDYLARSNLGDVLASAGDANGAKQAFTEAERLVRAQLAVNGRDAGMIIDLAWIGVEVRCAGAPAGKITAKEGELWVNDNMIKVCRGDSVRWAFKPPMPAAGAARILPKNASDSWLTGSFNGAEIVVDVPMTVRPTGEGTAYGYIVEVDGVGRLDPRLVVQ